MELYSPCPLDLCPELKGIKTEAQSCAIRVTFPWTYALNSKGLRRLQGRKLFTLLTLDLCPELKGIKTRPFLCPCSVDALDLCPELKGIKTMARVPMSPNTVPWTYALNSKGLRRHKQSMLDLVAVPGPMP